MISPDEIQEWVDKYKAKRRIFANLSETFSKIIAALCETREIPIQKFEYRAKDIESFRQKLIKKGSQYQNPLTDITDLAGVRVITYFKDDVDQVADLIYTNFLVDDKKTALHQPGIKELGYHSIQLITSLGSERENMAEYLEYRNIEAEIQIRTINQHAWAAVDHQYVYKRQDNPYPKEIRRRLNLLSGLYEICDNEFLTIREMIRSHDASAKTALAEDWESVPITATNIRAYLDSEPQEYEYITKDMRESGVTFLKRSLTRDSEFSEAAESLRECGLNTIGHLRNLLRKNYNNEVKSMFLNSTRASNENRTPMSQANFIEIISMIMMFRIAIDKQA